MAQFNGIDPSMVGLGCNNFGSRCDERQSAAVVQAALDAGVTLFDTADSYGGTRSEEYLGRALGARRAEVIIATKFGSRLPDGQGGAHPDYVPKAADASLRRLGTDWIDVYQLHFPDPDVPLADTMGALDGLVAAGKVRAIGCSNVTSSLLKESSQIAADKGFTPFATVQNELSLLQRRPEKNLLPACVALGAGFLPYFPLASGLLTGKYRRGHAVPEGTRLAGLPPERAERELADDRLALVEKLRAFADERGHTLLELAMSWLATRPAVLSIIAGATRPEQVRDNVAATTWRLSADDLAAIDAIVPPPA